MLFDYLGGKSLIQVNKVSKVYRDSKTRALDNLSLKIERGEFVFLVGSSGAGKSTLIKLIFREHDPTEGSLYFQNKNIVRIKGGELIRHRRQIGMVFQDFKLLKQKTVFENVAFALEVIGKSPKRIKEKVPEALEKVNLLHKATSYPDQLSGGEQQRVGIARAIVKDPLLIMADEPTGNLDRENSLQIMKLFDKINIAGTTVIIATHAKELVDSMQKRVLTLEDGKLVNDHEWGKYK